MNRIHVQDIIQAVSAICQSANVNLPDDVSKRLTEAQADEQSPIGRGVIDDLLTNAGIAKENVVPICQDTGMAVFFVDIGQGVHIEGGSIEDAINQGVREGYRDGFLRKSVVADPLRRTNTSDNTPAVIHYAIVPGNYLDITFAPKGFGSENMSRSVMLKPSDGLDGVIDFVVDTVSKAGPNPCPPIVVGVGIGGTLEKAALLAKRALTRPIGDAHLDSYYQDLERHLLDKINRLGIGPQGLGGTTTALAVHVSAFPTHIAGLPVVVNINCHASRHEHIRLG